MGLVERLRRRTRYQELLLISNVVRTPAGIFGPAEPDRMGVAVRFYDGTSWQDLGTMLPDIGDDGQPVTWRIVLNEDTDHG